MKTILLIETFEDACAAKKYLASRDRRNDRWVVINLNSSACYDFSGFADVVLKEEEDYMKDLPSDDINYQAVRDGRAWLFHKSTLSFLFFDRIDLRPIFEHNWVRSITTAYKFLAIIKKIVAVESPDKLVVFQRDPEPEQSDIRFTEEDTLADKVTLAMEAAGTFAGNVMIEKIQVGSAPPKRTRRSRGDPIDFVLQGLAFFARKLANACIGFCTNLQKDSILVSGAPRLLFAVIKELLLLKGMRVIYFLRETAPRSIPWLLKNGVPFCTLEDSKNLKESFQCGKESAAVAAEAFIKHLRAEGLFVSQGIDLTPIFRAKFSFLFGALIPRVRADIAGFKNILKRNRCRLVLLDEDMSYFSRSLILAARSLGIRTAEYQHGAPTRQYLQLSIADRKFLWGNFFRDKLLARTAIPADEIFVAGPVHMEYLAQARQEARREADKKYVRRRLGIPEDSRIVLFTPHPFHKGSKGGTLGCHHTRREVGDILSEVIDALGERTQTHLVIKLHHGDHRPDFYRDFIAHTGSNIRYSVVRDIFVHRLINACDLLISPVSTAILEAIILNRPVILVNLNDQEIIFPYVNWGAVIGVEEKGQLKACVDGLLNQPGDFFARTKAGRDKILQEFVCGMDGLSGERLREGITGLLNAPAVRAGSF